MSKYSGAGSRLHAFMIKLVSGFVIRTNKIPILGRLYERLYELSLYLICKAFGRYSEVVSIYLTGSMANDALRPGHSDIDLMVVTRDMDCTKEYDFLTGFWRTYARLRIPFPFLLHVLVLSVNDLTACMLQRHFSRLTVDDSSNNPRRGQRWGLVFGRESLAEAAGMRLDLTWPTRYFTLSIEAYLQVLGSYLTDQTHNEKMANRLSYLLGLGDDFFLNKSINHRGETVPSLLSDSMNSLGSHFRSHYSSESDIVKFKWAQEPKPKKDVDTVADEFCCLLNDFMHRAGDYVEAIIVSSKIATSSYQLVICLTDSLTEDEVSEALNALRDSTETLPKHVMIPEYPIVITADMIPILQYNEYCMGQFDYLHLIRHGRVIYGSQPKYPLPHSADFNERSIMGVSEMICKMSHYTRSVLPNDDVWPNDDVPPKLLADFLDYIFGILPSTRLIIEGGPVTTTPDETVKEYMKAHPDEECADNLQRYHKLGDYSLNKAYLFGRSITSRLAEWERHI
ncbi:MAG: nucleotidyltransferase domain-containing protein [Candidatus Brocadiales bacterium]|nr:nucleotidyltransferase domain-containing protein [Candidatus Brocadiales bacterium]